LRDGPPDLNPRQSGRSSKRQKRVRGTAALSQMRLKTSARSVFLNCPFDSKYENLYLALIAGATALGLTPRCVLEIPTTAARLTRLVDLISQCDYSIHDLSRVQLSGPAPRFELGLAVAVGVHENYGNHHWIVLEAVRYRLLRSLSDLNGFDPFIHGNSVSACSASLLTLLKNLDTLYQLCICVSCIVCSDFSRSTLRPPSD